MGFRDLILFYLVTGFSLRWIAQAAAAGPSSVIIWIIGALALYVPLVFTVLELSSRYPEEGGLYSWTRRAFGEFPGYLSGYLYWSSNLPYFPVLFRVFHPIFQVRFLARWLLRFFFHLPKYANR